MALVEQEQSMSQGDFETALQQLQSGQLADAKKIYERILEQDEKNVEAMINLAAIALEESDMNQAVAYCAQALKLHPGHLVACEVLAESNLRLAEGCQQLNAYPEYAKLVEDAVDLTDGDTQMRKRAVALLHRYAQEAQAAGLVSSASDYRKRATTLSHAGQQA